VIRATTIAILAILGLSSGAFAGSTIHVTVFTPKIVISPAGTRIYPGDPIRTHPGDPTRIIPQEPVRIYPGDPTRIIPELCGILGDEVDQAAW
jgi:hypothetical protein